MQPQGEAFPSICTPWPFVDTLLRFTEGASELEGNAMIAAAVSVVGRIRRQSTIVFAFLASTVIVEAAPPKNADPALATWFRSLKAPNGTACCAVADCRRAAHRLTKDGYEVLIANQWIAVPWERVLRRTDNPSGEAVVCRQPGTTLILCFVRPPDM